MINVKSIFDAVVKLAEHNPNRVYKKVGIAERCYYTKSGERNCPGCLIGQGIVAAYPNTWPILVQVDAGKTASISSLFSELGWWQYVTTEADQNIVNCLGFIQELQDADRPWGEAVDIARREYSL